MINKPNVARNVAAILSHNRMVYRSFGPYWWAVKRLLRAEGYGEGLGLSARADHPDWEKNRGDDGLIQEGLKLHHEMVCRGSGTDAVSVGPEGEEYRHYDPDIEV